MNPDHSADFVTSDIVGRQREFFLTGTTLEVKWRRMQLQRLKAAIVSHEHDLEEALATDLGRTAVEAYLCDIGPTIAEINEILGHLRHWARPELHYSGLLCFPSIFTRVHKMPYGVCLVISPFNFPFLLTFGVLAAAIAGGNTVVLKTSSKSPACTSLMKSIVDETFQSKYITLVEGGHDVADALLSQRFDKIFYTGSPAVGRHVLAMAAPNLTPVALELGGETGNWAIVRRDANLRDAARKIAFFKLLNAGQICININQVAVASEVADEFLHLLEDEFSRQNSNIAEAPTLINDTAWQRCHAWAERYAQHIVYGGRGDAVTRRYQPTILYPMSVDDDIVQQEHFSPLLPVVPYDDAHIDNLLHTIARREHPLAMYLFTRDRRWARRVMATQQYGGGCINEVCIHLMVKGVPFNGTGHSGIGAYHGIWGFREFTHPQTVLEGHTRLNLSLREHPYTGKVGTRKLRLLRWLER